MKQFICVISVLICSASFGGEGAWSKRAKLDEVVVNLDYSIYELTRSGQDTKDYEKYEGLVHLEYTRKGQSDLTFLNPWRVQLTFEYQYLGVIQSNVLSIGSEDGDHRFSDYIILPIIFGEIGYEIRVTEITGEYFDGMNWVSVVNPQSDINIPLDIDFRLELRSENWYHLEVQSPNPDQVNMNFDPASYSVKWNFIEGAEYYDLEWVFIDDESVEFDILQTTFSNLPWLAIGGYKEAFDKKEPSRVRVWRGYHILDKTYPGGKLYFRVRAVSNFKDVTGVYDQIEVGEWTYFRSPDALTVGIFTASDVLTHQISVNDEFELDKNWLYGVAYAEDGKSVSTLTYYDGSNRGRQSATYNTSDDVTLIGETKFDREGRQSISVIPAPVNGRQMGYQSNFNLAGVGNAFDENDIDIDPYIGTSFGLYSPPSGVGGSAQYFSPNNQFTSDLFRSSIPDAEGFVYSQTIYRNDGSGRIERVGGIGEEFQVGGDHAIRTFYGSPTARELKRLFGSNVSDDPNGYRKEMVRDANGQFSVTYFDKRGNVIATALAGESPDNLIALDNQMPELVVTELNDNNIPTDPYTIISEHTFPNPIENNPIVINYDLLGEINAVLPAQTITVGGVDINIGSLCSTCRYDLEIVVIDQQGQNVGGSPYQYDFNPPYVVDDCIQAPIQFPTVTINLTLPETEEYRIIKTLTVDKDAMWAAFLATLDAQGIPDETDFVEEYLLTVDYSACYSDCEEYCVADWKLIYKLNNPGSTSTDADIAWNALDPLAQEAAITVCMSENCDSDQLLGEMLLNSYMDVASSPGTYSNICETKKQQMIDQLMPGGYLFSTTLTDNAAVQLANGNTLDYYLIPANEVEWTREFAEEILDLHREYCHLELCDEWTESQAYSLGLSNFMNGAGWNGSDVVTPYNTDVNMGTYLSFSEDPFLNSTFNTFAGLNNNFQDRIANYLTYVQDGTLSIVNYVPPLQCGAISFPATGSLQDYVILYAQCLINDGATQSALELQLLTYLGIYNQLKEELVAEYKAQMDPVCEYFDDNYQIFVGDIDLQDMTNATAGLVNTVQNTIQPCETGAWNHTLHWLNQLSPECLTALGLLDVVGIPPLDFLQFNFTFTDLDNAYVGNASNNVAELFYAFAMETCPANTWGWFYDPDESGLNPTAPGAEEYDAIALALTTTTECGLTQPFSFEVSPSPGIIEIPSGFNIMNQSEIEVMQALQQIIDVGFADNNQHLNGVQNGNSTTWTTSLSSYPLLYGYTGTASIVKTFTAGATPIYDEWATEAEFTITKNGCIYQYTYFLNVPSEFGWIDILNIDLYYSLTQYNVKAAIYKIDFSTGILSQVLLAQDNKLNTCTPPPDFSNNLLDLSGAQVPTPDFESDCFAAELAQATIDAQILYDDFIDDLYDSFLASLNCINSANENLTMSYYLKEYQYTLYYYDLAGNLVQTVPPQGVDIVDAIHFDNNGVWDGTDPIHRLETRYEYNGLNTLVGQFTPDGGHTDFHLDKLYRVRYSQNARQIDQRRASYTKYDELGRVTEAGEFRLPASVPTSFDNSLEYAYLMSMVDDNTFPTLERMDHTLTFYEEIYPNDVGGTILASFEGGEQTNLRNAIGAIVHVQKDYNASGFPLIGSSVTTVISYSYDPHKNVKQMVSTNYDGAIGHRNKSVEYGYDLISGNVNELIYQKSFEDEYRHKFHYDANNRLIRAFTSKDGGVQWEMDAKYFYYLHGALARTEIGHDKVQGTDYAYNLQGWIKGVNSSTLIASRDIGHDAGNGNNQYFGSDAFGFNLGYFAGDYQAIDNTNTSFANTDDLAALNIYGANQMGSLFNGNISHMVTAMRDNDENPLDILGNNYQYDQLQRIKSMNVYNAPNLVGNNNFNGAVLYNSGGYGTNYSFDQNGNLLSLLRNGADGTLMDEFTYGYYEASSNTSPTGNAVLESNRLASVSDLVDAAYADDITPGQLADNYQYDASGQLTQDLQEGIEEIIWTVTGKVKEIRFTAASGKNRLKFIYDPMDMRIAKMEYLDDQCTAIKYTYYSYDAQGNVLATYERTQGVGHTNYLFADKYTLKEHMIYGSSRLGVDNRNLLLTTSEIYDPNPPNSPYSLCGPIALAHTNVVNLSYDKTQRVVGNKFYELSNHLGNVLEVVTDRKLGYDNGTYDTPFGTQLSVTLDGVYDYYTADVVSYSDYYPYGMLMDGRHGQAQSDYRYGFQGQEMDDEVKGEGNSYGYHARIYDNRIGRWLSRDPVEYKKPFLSPYQSFRNNPIYYIDPDGGDEWKFYADGSWTYTKTEKHVGKEGYWGGDLFITVNEQGEGNNIFSPGNLLYGAVPFVDIAQQDLNDEFGGRPEAWALFKAIDPKGANLQNVIYALTIVDAVVGVVEGVAGLVTITKAIYKGGKMMYTIVRAGKTYSNVEAIGKGFRIGKITYENAKAFTDVSAKELDMLSYLNKRGEETLVLARKVGEKTADFKILGNTWELKTIEDITSKQIVRAVKDALLKKGKLQSGNLIGDVRNLDNFTIDDAYNTAKSAFLQSSRPKRIRIVGKGFDKTYYRSDFIKK